MSDRFKYRAFLSYSHQDLEWADWLHRVLERYRVPPRLRESADTDRPLPRNLRPIFRDRDELSSGSSLSQGIKDALADSESLIVICSPAAVASGWVDEEIREFQLLGRGDRIFCLIVEGEPLSGGPDECFPEALRHPVDTRGRPLVSPEEPIAADARGGRHDRNHARMMLIAGLLGIGLDELLQRDHHRRTRRLFAMAAGTTVVSLLMVGLMIFAFLAQAEAERRRADAENLVGFMLGDLREDLHAIQRLDVYNSVSEKAMEYFRSLDEKDAREEVLAQRAEALRQIGDSRLDQGDMAGALESFEESLAIASQLAVKNPSRVDWNLGLAKSHFYIGYVHWQRGDLEQAAEMFLEQLSIVDALATAEPENAERLAASGYAWTNYGRVLELSGRYPEARQAYETVMEVFIRLEALQPEDVDTRLEVGFAHNNLGKLKTSLGMLDAAESHFRSDLAIKQQVVDEFPGNNLWREFLAVSHFWLGKLLEARGQLAESREQGDSALQVFNSLIDTDASNMHWLQRRAAVRRLLAAVCRQQGDSVCAGMHIERSQADLDILVEANPENAQWQRELGFSRIEAAWQAALAGQPERATGLVDDVLRPISIPDDEAAIDSETCKLKALALLTKGDLDHRVNHEAGALLAWQSALDTLEGPFNNTLNPEFIDLQARLFERLGMTLEAGVAAEQLSVLGFNSSYPPLYAPSEFPGAGSR